ncbi:MAG: hypothetical protein WDO13_15395 [Verrucomicrobiota bacterium]
MWNLNQQLEVRVKLKNTGTAAVKPRVQLESRGGSSEDGGGECADRPRQRGGNRRAFRGGGALEGHLGARTKCAGGQEILGRGTRNRDGLREQSGHQRGPFARHGGGAQSLQVTSITADLPPADIPAWLGQRPPVEGDWVKTFDDEFDGNAIDLTKWNIYTKEAGHLGAQTHYTKDNVIVKNGALTLRVEKKNGHQDDNPPCPPTTSPPATPIPSANGASATATSRAA